MGCRNHVNGCLHGLAASKWPLKEFKRIYGHLTHYVLDLKDTALSKPNYAERFPCFSLHATATDLPDLRI